MTPFLSWIRSIDGRFDRQVDFFYSVAHAEDAVDLDEIRGVADRHPSLRVHLVCADTDGKLTPDAVMHDASRGAQSMGLHVRAATDDARLLRRLAKARRPGRPHSLGAVRCALSRRGLAELDLALVTFPGVNAAVVGFVAVGAGSALDAARC